MRLFDHRILFVLMMFLSAVAGPALAADFRDMIDLASSDQWRYLNTGDHMPRSWVQSNFDDSSWNTAAGPFEYTSEGNLSRLYLRHLFSVPYPAIVTTLMLNVTIDGPFVVYINGIEVFRTPKRRAGGVPINLSGITDELVAGNNVVAVEVTPERANFSTLVAAIALHLEFSEPLSPSTTDPKAQPLLPAYLNDTRHLIIMICDGCGRQQIEAANLYSGTIPEHQSGGDWTTTWMSTFPEGSGYDPDQTWSDFTHPLQGVTDSAAAATAMFTGHKTANGRISVDAAGTHRLYSIGERVRTLGMRVGAITTVPASHATPGAFTSHNEARSLTYAIGDEAFFGDPNTTGTPANDPKYGGGFGSTLPPPEIIVGTGASTYVSPLQRTKLITESGRPGKPAFIEGTAGVDGGAALRSAAALLGPHRLIGLFDRVNLSATADQWGYRLETPALSESTMAAIAVLEREPRGFVLMIEGGAIDWASHANELDWAIGEMLDFNSAVQTVADWVDDATNDSTWNNTLLIVTSDHETGYLTRGPGVFPDQLLDPGSVNDTALGLEKIEISTGRRASWLDDSPANDLIDVGETVFWAWNSGGHSNTLVPLFSRGVGSELFLKLAVNFDPVRGPYINNTDVFAVSDTVMSGVSTLFIDGFESGTSSAWNGGIAR